MESFQLLSRGGVKFDKQRFRKDVQLFQEEKRPGTNSLGKKQAIYELPPELDFFKYAQRDAAKRKSAESVREEKQNVGNKRVKRGGIDEDEGQSQPRHRVTTKGTNVPEPVESFDALQERYNVSSRIMQNLKEYGYTKPTEIQAHAISILLEGRDLAVISPTGTGKTLSYIVPIMASLKAPISSSKNPEGVGVRAVVIAPTRELAHQIHNECMKLAQGRKWRIILLSKATASTLVGKSLRDNVDVIVSTPLRLLDSVQHGNLSLDDVRHLVLDEADRLLDAEFLTQTQEILSACTHESVQKSVFSATLPSGVEQIAMRAMRNPIRVVVGIKDTPLPSISQKLVYVADESSKLPTVLQYLSQPYSPPIMIFTSTQPRASSLADQMVLNGVQNVDCLHAGMTMRERQEAALRMKKGESWIMICTEVMARGMDFKGVQGVINFDFPTSVQSYIHRIGRTGRAGREGTAITYFTDEDAPFLKPIANVILQSGSTVHEWILKLPKPSKLKRRAMGRVKRGDGVTTDDIVGKREALRRREMIKGSKRRKAKARTRARDGSEDNVDGSSSEY